MEQTSGCLILPPMRCSRRNSHTSPRDKTLKKLEKLRLPRKQYQFGVGNSANGDTYWQRDVGSHVPVPHQIRLASNDIGMQTE